MLSDTGRLMRSRRCLAVFAVALISLALSGCSVLLTHPDAFQTGQILEPGQAEIGVHTYGGAPAGASLGIADYDGWEARIGFGRVGNHPLGLEMSGVRQILASVPWRMSAGIGFEALSPDQEIVFAGLRASATYSVGFFPGNAFGIYVPLKVSYTRAIPGDYQQIGAFPGYSSLAFVPGIGFSFEYEHLTFRLAGNYPFYQRVVGNGVQMIPYVGAQLAYHFRLL
jgi:hypothetical protein